MSDTSIDQAWLRELELFADNDQACYRQRQAIEKNLLRKMVKGTYDSVKAFKSWLNYAEAARQMYRRAFDCPLAPVAVKREMAGRESAHFESEVSNGCFDPADYGLKGTLLTTI